ncbi:MAG: RsmF rRNA methyltransferase first C-terminal domain-containing protein, partial [Chitinophagaceae bacterium]
TKELGAHYLPLTIDPDWNITDTGSGYRFWPDKVKGEGFFLSCFQKKEGDTETSIRGKSKPELAGKKEMELIAHWVKTGQHQFIKYEQTVYAWPEALTDDFSLLLKQLRVIYSGTQAGELMRDKLVPDHALAMSTLVVDSAIRTGLTYEQAIRYLQRKELEWEDEKKGWQLVTYEDQPLGWVNVLANRVNNYYPKELRILKDSV